MTDHLELLNRLEGVRQTAPERWVAKCPAHTDRSPSLSLRDAGDRLLVTCHAQCGFYDVIGAVGLPPSALFANPKAANRSLYKDDIRLPTMDLMLLIQQELLVVAIAAKTLADGGQLDATDKPRFEKAINRLFTIHGSATS